MRAQALSNLLLHGTEELLVVQPVGADAGEKCLVINRADAKISVEGTRGAALQKKSSIGSVDQLGAPSLLRSASGAWKAVSSLHCHLSLQPGRQSSRLRPQEESLVLSALQSFF